MSKPDPGTPISPRPTRTSGHPKRQVIFVHGLGGDSEATWGEFPSLLMKDQEVAERFDVRYYSFDTAAFRLPFSSNPATIQALADGLETYIRVNDLSDAVLVCHSLGGLIARHYLVKEVKDGKPMRVSAMALFAVPNNGAGLAEAAKYFSWRNNHLAQLCRGADILELLNEDWVRSGIQNKVRTRFILGTQDRVVSAASAKGFWGNPHVDTIAGRGHLDIVKPTSADDLAVQIVRKLLLTEIGATASKQNTNLDGNGEGTVEYYQVEFHCQIDQNILTQIEPAWKAGTGVVPFQTTSFFSALRWRLDGKKAFLAFEYEDGVLYLASRPRLREYGTISPELSRIPVDQVQNYPSDFTLFPALPSPIGLRLEHNLPASILMTDKNTRARVRVRLRL